MSYKIDSIHGTAKLITSSDGGSINDLAKEDIINLNRESGVLLFRGFGADINDFSDFVKQNSGVVTLDPARSFHAENAQKVDAGMDSVGLHCENGNAPKLPHFIWFYCKKSAKIGSQTTFCDGRGVWGSLSDKTKTLFENNRIKYARTVPEQLWKSYLAYELPHINSPEEVKPEHLDLLAGQVEGQSFTLNDDMSVHYEFSVGATHETVFSDELSFANSILGPSFNYEKPVITFENGDAIPEDILDEIRQVTEQETQEINWQDNDIVMIDNTRFMHGRRAIQDPDREIYAALSYL